MNSEFPRTEEPIDVLGAETDDAPVAPPSTPPRRRARRHRAGLGRTLVGVGIAGLGLAFILEYFGVVEAEHIIRFWPLLLVAVGLNQFAAGKVFWGSIVVFAGLVFQAATLGVDVVPGELIWPLILVAIGLKIVFGPRVDPDVGERIRHGLRQRDRRSGGADRVDAVAVFGGAERRVTSRSFQGGDAMAVFGGTELDLRDAEIEGTAVIDAFAAFGGVEIRVPDHWHVVSDGVGILGGFGDERRRVPAPGSDAPTLVVHGMAVFGAVEIKN